MPMNILQFLLNDINVNKCTTSFKPALIGANDYDGSIKLSLSLKVNNNYASNDYF